MQVIMTIGPKGQVVIPKQFRDEFRIKPGDEVVIMNEQNTLQIIKKSEQIEKIMTEITEFAHKYGRKNKIDMNEEFDKETDEMIKRWKIPIRSRT